MNAIKKFLFKPIDPILPLLAIIGAMLVGAVSIGAHCGQKFQPTLASDELDCAKVVWKDTVIDALDYLDGKKNLDGALADEVGTLAMGVACALGRLAADFKWGICGADPLAKCDPVAPASDAGVTMHSRASQEPDLSVEVSKAAKAHEYLRKFYQKRGLKPAKYYDGVDGGG